MSWQRFEGRKAVDRELFTVSLVSSPSQANGAYLSLNRTEAR